MVHFIDETRLVVSSGTGGNGSVSFRREKYIPEGGPDGGDGGKGGDVVFLVRRNLRTFAHLQNKHRFVADNGKAGSGAGMTGAAGPDLIIPVPPGTRALDYKTREVLLDAGEEEGISTLFLRGGRGGAGNIRFKSSRNRAPKRAGAGRPGVTREILLEMSVIADIGFVGYPNAGKSSLLAALTAARPTVAPYPFTTRSPHLGMLRVGDQEIVLADIPGLIKGAAQGQGLGHRFLKHITRTGALMFLVEMSDDNALETIAVLKEELGSYNPALLDLPRLIVASKMDLEGAEERFNALKQAVKDEPVISISTHAGVGLTALIDAFRLLKKQLPLKKTSSS